MTRRTFLTGLTMAVLLPLTAPTSGPAVAGTPATPPPVPFTDFKWGVATAGFQSEGGDRHSNWAHWKPKDPSIEPIGRAMDFWNRYDEDMALAENLGVTAFRLSVEWSRIEPTAGAWDEDAIAHYQAMFAALRRHHLQPVVTLSHWTMPAWVDARGGWTNPDIPRRFAAFVSLVTSRIAPDCHYWLTFNEPNVWLVRDYLLGMFPPCRSSLADLSAARTQVLAGHALAYDIIHRRIPDAMVSVNLYYVQMMTGSWLAFPLGPDPLDNKGDFRKYRDAAAPDGTPPPPYGRLDYLSYDYYYAFRTVRDILNLRDPWLLPVNPPQLTDALLDFHRQFGLPQLIAENGLATNNGAPRPDGLTPSGILLDTVEAMRTAQKQGAKLIGYCYWTLTDNYEWGTFSPRFGLYRVEHRDPTLARHPTPTADTYRQLIRRERKRASGPG